LSAFFYEKILHKHYTSLFLSKYLTEAFTYCLYLFAINNGFILNDSESVKKVLYSFAFASLVLASCQNNDSKNIEKKRDSTATQKAADESAAKAEIVYVNADSLVLGYELYQKSKKEFQDKQTQYDTDINGRASNLEREIASFQQTVNSMTLQTAKETEARLLDKQKTLMQYRESLAKQLVEDERQVTEKINQNIDDFMKRYAKEQGFKMILSYKQGVTAWYMDADLDITKEVLRQLNKEYQEQQKPAVEEKKK
jgi:outer membrane protein